MDELLGKLTNLSYDFFGAVLPGFVVLLFLWCSWWALGPLAPCVGLWELPPPDMMKVLDGSVLAGSFAEVIAFLVMVALIAYLSGHVLHWVARARISDPRLMERAKKSSQRVWHSLTLRIPKPEENFKPQLEVLYETTRRRILPASRVELFDSTEPNRWHLVHYDPTLEPADKERVNWHPFFLVAKTLLAQRQKYSLVTTYQNKYTLHRTVTSAGSGWFYIGLLSVALGLCSSLWGGPSPYWGWVCFFLVCSLLIVWAFSGSYMYHWENFGNSIVTEAYALTSESANDATKKP